MEENRVDVSPRALPGLRKKSFSLYYGGGEIWVEHLDGMYEYGEVVLKKLREDSVAFSKPSRPGFMAVNLDETHTDTQIMKAIVDSIMACGQKFRKVAFVGLDRRHRRGMGECFANSGINGVAIAYFDDFEKAKEWLI